MLLVAKTIIIIVATHCMVRNEGGLEEQRKEGERENQIIDV